MKAEYTARRDITWQYGVALAAVLIGVASTLLLNAVFLLLALAGALLGAFTAYFFRDPNRKITSERSAIVSPADGTIVGIEDLISSPHYDGPCKRISIFLSVFNVHINRSPFEGTVESIQYKPGEFRNAMRADTTDVNESNTVRMKTDRGAMTVRQISGLIARRIICKVEVGETLAKGEKFGMIKFGSRTELYLPVNVEICAKMKDKVAGGATILARFPE